MALGGNFKCKLATNPGGAPYLSGYCTKICTGQADCPQATSYCQGLSPTYGENDRICMKRCPTGSECRSSGYACYNVGPNTLCWLDPLPSVDAGPPSDKVGIPCTADGTCQNPPSDGFCLPPVLPDGGPSGYTDGYCTAQCADSAHCGDGGICITFGSGSSSFEMCQKVCSGPGLGQSDCRLDYACQGYLVGLLDGGSEPSPDGICRPSCAAAGWGCPTGKTCGDGGYCF